MFSLFRSKPDIAKLVASLSSKDESKARRAAAALDSLLYPNYGPGPRVVTAPESNRILDAHYASVRRAEVLDPLLSAIHEGSEFARTYSATVLGHIGDLRAVPLLIAAASDPSQSVRQATARSLGFLRDASAVSVLTRMLADSDPEVCRAAASALGHIRAPEVVPALLALFGGNDCESKVTALSALGCIGDPQSLPLIRSALLDKSRKVRHAAKSALAQFDFQRRHDASQVSAAPMKAINCNDGGA